MYDIKTICKTIEAIKSNKLILQCKTCQYFGHPKYYCNNAPRCLKFAGPYLTVQYQNLKNAHPKGCHCGKNYPANYRGCE